VALAAIPIHGQISRALPLAVHHSLGVSPAVQDSSDEESHYTRDVSPAVDAKGKDPEELLNRAIELRPKCAQACWISFVQDLARCCCIGAGHVSVSEESGDRAPDDLTVVPIRLDAITVLLTCIVLGMQVYKYPPTTGEITLAGGVDSISSSSHPVLGTLLHSSVFRNEIVGELEETKRHAYLDAVDVLSCPLHRGVHSEAQNASRRHGSQKKFEKDVLNHDPSSWFPIIAAWEIIMRADQCMCHLQFDGVTGGGFHDLINAITVHAISLGRGF
jgi:hypothetical protein